MSEQANTQLVKQAYQLFKAGNIPSFLNLLAEDVLWFMPAIANVPFARTWRGRHEVEQFFKLLSEMQDVVEFEPEEFIAQGDKVVVLGHFTMHVKATVSCMREFVDTLAVSRAHSVA
jgi:ketosteroid isomerase-like protein